jgi:alpha-tubulin suppressor-like RCC1 family protein
MRCSTFYRIALLIVTAACAADRPGAPAVVVLDDVGTGDWRSVSTGRDHTCAIDGDGRAWCWGSNESFQLGVAQPGFICADSIPCSPFPVPVATGRTFLSISAGRAHTCGIATDSVPFCWGANAEGQLGTRDLPSPELRIPGTSPMISLSAGGNHSCGVRTDNQLVCWGSNRFGAVGAGGGIGIPPTLVGGNFRFSSVEVSDQRSCARTTAGRIMCWGAIWSRTSGDTNFTQVVPSPTLVGGLGLMATMDVGPTSACTVDATGFVWCWESNVNGQGGIGPGPGSATPRRVATDEAFSRISVGNAYACGVTIDGAGYCWGSNRNLQIGATTTEYCGSSRSPCTTRPVRVSGRQRFMTISAGLGTHVCGVTDQFNLYCWGSGAFGQRGDGTTTALSRIPRLAVDVHHN